MTSATTIEIPVSKTLGRVSGRLLLPENATALLVLGHGAGAGREHPFMELLARELAAQQIGTLRYNFLYMEKGGGGVDRPAKAHPVIRAAVRAALPHAKGLTLLAGGKSFGGRMTSQVAAQGELPDVRGIIYYGFPLHAAGKPGTERAAHLSDITQPQLFLQGTRDTLARLDLIQGVCGKLPQARLVIMEGADHSFKTLKRSGITHEATVQRLAEATVVWTAELADR